VVTNVVVEKTVEQQVVVVTIRRPNSAVQSASGVCADVQSYTVYYPPPAYVYNPLAPLVTFGAGMAMGAIIANNCDWHGGGCYHGDVNINVNQNVNVNRNANVNNARSTAAGQAGATGARPSSTSGQTKWQPDQSRLSKSGSPTAANSARSTEARGWGSSGAGPSTGAAGARPSTGTASARPSIRNCRGPPFHWHTLGEPAHDVSQRQPAQSIAQRFATQGESFGQPSFLVGQCVRRREQRWRGPCCQQPGRLQPQQRRLQRRKRRRWRRTRGGGGGGRGGGGRR